MTERTYTPEECRRKADQCWEQAGLARADNDLLDAAEQTKHARIWERRAAAGGYTEPSIRKPMARFVASYAAGKLRYSAASATANEAVAALKLRLPDGLRGSSIRVDIEDTYDVYPLERRKVHIY